MESDDFSAVTESVRQWIREKVVPLEAEIEETDAIPQPIAVQAKALGLYGFALPEKYGGMGLSMWQEAQLMFELGYTTPSLRSMFGTNNGIAGHVLLEGGTEEQKEFWVPRLATGEVVASFALTEEDAGSDPSSLKTRAERTDDGWVLSGSKRYITNAPVADVFMVFARTDPESTGGRGISVFMVDRESAGLTVGPKDVKMGQRGSWTADVQLDEVVVGADRLVGGADGEGNGYRVAMRCLAHGRVHIASLCVGMIQRLVDESVGYAASRVQGGKIIGEHQLIQALLADSQTDLMAGRSLVLEVARAFDSHEDRTIGPSCAKYFCSEAVNRVADRAVQIHGGAGYMRGVNVERFYRDARLFTIYEGTSQIQQIIIGRQLIRNRV